MIHGLTVIQELMLICYGSDSDSGAKVDLSWELRLMTVIQELRLICHGFDSDSGAKVDLLWL